MVDLQEILARVRTRDSFTRNVASTLAVQVLTLLLGVATSAITARWLGAEGRGVLQLCLLAPAFLGLLLGCGIAGANVHYLGSRRFDVPSLTSNAVALAIVVTGVGSLAVFAVVVTGALNRVLPSVPIPLLIVAMVGLPIALLASYLNSVLQGLQRITALNRITLASGCLSLALVVVLVVGLKLGVVGALLATLGASAFGLGQAVARLRNEGASFSPRWDSRVLRTTLRFGVRGHVGGVIGFFNYRLDVFLVNGMLGPASVGLYGVATRLAELVWYLPNAVGFALLPKAAATETREMNRFTPRVCIVTFGATAVAAAALAAVGRPLIRWVFSSAFNAAYAPMVALLPGVVLLGVARVLGNDISGRGYPLYSSMSSGVTLVATVLLNLLLIPRLGITGAALASTGAYAVSLLSALVAYGIVSRKAAATPLQADAQAGAEYPPEPGSC